jgi:hypothetical protein
VTPDAALVAVLAALEAAGVPYMIVGSLASNFHGVPRSTRDADIVVQLSAGSLERLRRELAPGLRLQPQGSFETVTGTIRHVIVLAGSPFVCELFQLSDDPHDVERFARRARAQVLAHTAYVATAEDMIVTKLRWAAGAGRSKDREDIRNIIAVQGAGLDWEYLDRWSIAHGTAGLLAEIRGSVPPA